MTKLSVVAHLGMVEGGWTESKKANLDKIDSRPSLTGLNALGLASRRWPHAYTDAAASVSGKSNRMD